MFSIVAYDRSIHINGNPPGKERRYRFEGAKALTAALAAQTSGTPAERIGAALRAFLDEDKNEDKNEDKKRELRFNLSKQPMGEEARLTGVESVDPNIVVCNWQSLRSPERKGKIKIVVHSDADDGKGGLTMNVVDSGNMYGLTYLEEIFEDLRSVGRQGALPDGALENAPPLNGSVPEKKQFARAALSAAIMFRRCL